MVQTLTRTDAGHIAYKVTIEDPVYYSAPFTNERTFTRRQHRTARVLVRGEQPLALGRPDQDLAGPGLRDSCK